MTGVGRTRPDVAKNLEAVQARKLYVEDHEVRVLVGHPGDRLVSFEGKRAAVARVLQVAADDLHHRRLVIDDQDGGGARARSAWL